MTCVIFSDWLYPGHYTKGVDKPWVALGDFNCLGNIMKDLAKLFVCRRFCSYEPICRLVIWRTWNTLEDSALRIINKVENDMCLSKLIRSNVMKSGTTTTQELKEHLITFLWSLNFSNLPISHVCSNSATFGFKRKTSLR